MARATDKPKNIRKTQTENAVSEYVPAPNLKDIAVEQLKKRGLNVRNDGGILMAYYKGKEEYAQTLQKLEAAIREIGYNGSYGVRPSSGAMEFGDI